MFNRSSKIWSAILIFSLIYIKIVGAVSISSKNYEMPLFIQIFLFSNVFLILVATVLIWEIKRSVPSNIWNSIIKGNFFDVFYALIVAALLNKLYSATSSSILLSIAVFHSLATIMLVAVVYLLVKPIIREKINLLKTEYILIYGLSTFAVYNIIKIIPKIEFPVFPELKLFFFLSFILVLILYFGYSAFYISRAYRKIGFVYEPFLVVGIGTASILISAALIIYSSSKDVYTMYYYVLFYFIISAFTFLHYFQFLIGYPSLLQQKWKSLLPFDLVKVAVAFTLAFLAASVFFTVKETPSFAIYQSVSYTPLIISLFAISTLVTLIFTYIKIITQNSELRYWSYLKTGLTIHLISTFYIFSLTALLWNEMTLKTKLIAYMFWLLAFFFYLFYVLDLRTVIRDLGLTISHSKLEVARYLVSLYSGFFLVLFGISFTIGKNVSLGISLESSPVILFFIAVFLLSFTTYLSVVHKGLEELLTVNVWSELSYMASFAAFVVVYFFYRYIDLQRFPLHDLFFVGYFTTLAIEIVSIRTLGIESKYQKRTETIQDLLNYHTGAWLRADYLEQLWESIADRYEALSEELTRIRFDPSIRGFNLRRLSENAKTTLAVAMLIEMYKLEELSKITITGASNESIKEEIEEVLKERILLLPEELRAQFKEEKYYPNLFEKCINDLMKKIEAFVPWKEQEAIHKKLASIDSFFKEISFKDKITIHTPEISREEFLHNFKKYIAAIETEFPFQYTLLHDAVREEIADVLHLYGFTVEEILDIVPTGFGPLDEATDGGLIKRTSTLLATEESKKKNEILTSFALQGLKHKDCVIYVTSKIPSKEVLELMAGEDLSRLMVIDLYRDIYAQNQVKEIAEDGNIISIPANATLFQHSVVRAIKKYPREAHKRIILDAYPDLLKYYAWGGLFEILQKQLDGFRKWNCTTVVALDKDLLPPTQIEVVKRSFDNVVALSGRGREASAAIQKLYGGTPKKAVISL